MKKHLSSFLVIALAVVLGSCGTTRRTAENDFYNKHNELKVKAKNGLFSSLHFTFGPYSTGEKASGVDKQIISFATSRAPSHFSITDGDGHTSAVQAVYTDKRSLEDKRLPEALDTIRYGEIFYAWIRGGSQNALKNWELMVKNPTYTQLADNQEVGVLRSLTDLIEIHANNRFGSPDSYDNMCFEFQLRGVPVAAVTVNGLVRIWIDRHLDDQTKFAVAAAIASLLMR